MTKIKEEKKCNIKNCSDVGKVRGLCPSHYAPTRKLISEGFTTEEILVKKGILLERKGGRYNNKFTKEIIDSL